MLLPELGPPAPTSDRATMFEAIRCALHTLAPALVLLDDLQWSDGATLELLAALAAPLRELPLLVVAAYRSDELAAAIRCGACAPTCAAAGCCASSPWRRSTAGEHRSSPSTCSAAGRRRRSPARCTTARRACRSSSRSSPPRCRRATAYRGRGGLELDHDDEVPVPETIRDAVLLRTAALSPDGRAAAERRPWPARTSSSISSPGLDELLATGLVDETEPGRAAFRHSLARGAIYEDIQWLRRRELHAQLAQRLTAAGAPSAEIAAHWLAAGDADSALDAFLASARELAAVHAYRDAARAALQALDLWPEGDRPAERLAALDAYAHSAELAGDLAEAARALREAAAAQRTERVRTAATTERRLAALYDLLGDRDRALAARLDAAGSFAAAGLPGEAAAERLRVAGYRQSAGRQSDAVELAITAAEEATRAERTDLRARALGLEGVARAKRGEFAEGVETIRAGLSLALEHELTAEAAELYQRLGTALETAADYGGAREALHTAVGLCEASGANGQEHTCLSCMAYVLRELGDWDQAAELSRELGAGSARPDDALVADGILGSILAFRGDARAGRPLLARCLATSTRLDVVSMGVDSAAALGWSAAHAGDHAVAGEHLRAVLERWERSEDHHYAVWGLRTGAWVFATGGDLARARACAEALSAIAADAGHPYALAALAHALGETALQEGDADAAARQFGRALELHADLDTPFERAQIAVRTGVALAAAGERELAAQRLEEAYRAARRLGSRPVASAAADELARLGEPLERRLGRRAAAAHEGAGLSRRELEVMRLVSVGRTNREIARELFLSPRTVDMHVRNILAKLSCRTRTEAASRAAELGLLA